MAKINDYYRKKELIQQLAEELNELENDEALKKDLAFEKEFGDLLMLHEKSARDAMEILCLVDPTLENGSEVGLTKSRAKRPLKTYTNPHTGEQVKTKGGNQKTLIAWREQYGAEAVHSWAD